MNDNERKKLAEIRENFADVCTKTGARKQLALQQLEKNLEELQQLLEQSPR